MSQNLQNFVKFQNFLLDNLVDFEKCCKTHIFLQKSGPIQPKTSNILLKFRRPGRIVVQAEDFLSSSVTPATPARSRLPSGCELGGSRLRHLAESCRIFSRIFAENEPRPVFCIDQGSRDLIWERFYPFLIGGSGAGRSGSLKVGPARVFQDRHAAPEGDVFLREDESERHRLCAAGR